MSPTNFLFAILSVGESLSDEEKDKEEDDQFKDEDDDDDDGFFVGHGVLGKDELHQNSDDDDEEGEGDFKKNLFHKVRFYHCTFISGEIYDEEEEQKKQRLREQQFEAEYKKKRPAKLKPRVFGCFFIGENQSLAICVSRNSDSRLLSCRRQNRPTGVRATPTHS